jgi:CheY-like chemotaxis protein
VGFNVEAVETRHAVNGAQFGLLSIGERMKALGGFFDIESSPGRGTLATMTLPLALEAPALVAQQSSLGLEIRESKFEAPTSADPTLKGMTPKIRVLLVDDHVMVRQGLRGILATYPDIDIVGEASNGQQAVISAASLQPSVVVMDVNMPIMNGITATENITVRFPHMVIIGLSVDAALGNQEAMKAAGAFVLLTKESAVEHLYKTIIQAVQSRTGRQTGERGTQVSFN